MTADKTFCETCGSRLAGPADDLRDEGLNQPPPLVTPMDGSDRNDAAELARLPDDVFAIGAQTVNERGNLAWALARVLGRDLTFRDGVHPLDVRSAYHMGDARYGHAWKAWDRDMAMGATRSEVLRRSSARSLVHLLGAQEGIARAVERNVIATELLNRLALTEAARADAAVRGCELWNVVTSSERRGAETRSLILASRRLVAARQPTGPSLAFGASAE